MNCPVLTGIHTRCLTSNSGVERDGRRQARVGWAEHSESQHKTVQPNKPIDLCTPIFIFVSVSLGFAALSPTYASYSLI